MYASSRGLLARYCEGSIEGSSAAAAHDDKFTLWNNPDAVGEIARGDDARALVGVGARSGLLASATLDLWAAETGVSGLEMEGPDSALDEGPANRKLCILLLSACNTDCRSRPGAAVSSSADCLGLPCPSPWFMKVVWMDESDMPRRLRVRSRSVLCTTSCSSPCAA
ncbi:hypothetical protein AcV7_010366 [Taiwanofungus camphoratus]|nr:hypothetical protein AcV7_010366 [Antrodia cinnamomea]